MKEEKKNLLFGTKEWAPHTFNYMNGCSNDCVYCYAKTMAIRFKRKTADTWKVEESVSMKNRTTRKRNGRIMIPSSHDITPGNIDITLSMMKALLEKDNQLLVVTKPHYDCVSKIAKEFIKYKKNIYFRFTIGSANDKVLKLWEPGSTTFKERLISVKLAYDLGYSTSISCEPLLDNEFDILYEKINKYVTDKIWVGKMNLAKSRVRINSNSNFPEDKIDELMEWQSDENIIKLYNKYKNNSKIEWKESIKKVAIDYNL